MLLCVWTQLRDVIFFQCNADFSPAGPYNPGEHRVPLHIQAPVWQIKGNDIEDRPNLDKKNGWNRDHDREHPRQMILT
jgi:hypothetical protein